ncbi:MAG: protein-glutamate O-methyltransferase CheR [Paludibacter sp.]
MTKEEYLFEISIKIVSILGLDFQPNQWVDMERRTMAAATDLKIDASIPGLLEWLSKPTFTNIELNTLSGHLTVNETYFFREMTALELFTHDIIPSIIKERRGKNEKIKIWSAGCSSGEEPYTLAIILNEHFPELKDWEITILATDISPNAIQKALHGEYTEWSFRNTDYHLKNKYFSPSGKNWKISPKIKKMVSFSYLNLSKNSYPSSATNTEQVDVIFCRNVMMYFTPQVINEVSARFKKSIVENGWFITSQVELNDEYFSNFERVNYLNGIFYRKTNKPKEIVKARLDLQPSNNYTRIIKEKQKKQLEPAEKNITVTKPTEIFYSTKTDPESYFQKGEYKDCIDSCLFSIAQGGLNNKVFTVLIKSYANLGLFQSGQKVMSQIENSKAVTAEMYYIYASLLNEQNDLKQTEQHLKKAIYLNHNHILSHLMLGDIFLKTDKRTLATKHYENIIRIVSQLNDNEIVPDSDGLTVGRIKELTESIINKL